MRLASSAMPINAQKTGQNSVQNVCNKLGFFLADTVRGKQLLVLPVRANAEARAKTANWIRGHDAKDNVRLDAALVAKAKRDTELVNIASEMSKKLTQLATEYPPRLSEKQKRVGLKVFAKYLAELKNCKESANALSNGSWSSWFDKKSPIGSMETIQGQVDDVTYKKETSKEATLIMGHF